MTKTRLSVLRRMDGSIRSYAVPKFAQDVIDHMSDILSAEAFKKWPRSTDPRTEEENYWHRLDFYKTHAIKAFLREYRNDVLDTLLRGRAINSGQAAIWFNQYIASIKKGNDAVIGIDDDVLSVTAGDLQPDDDDLDEVVFHYRTA